jgi:hypothetical protein
MDSTWAIEGRWELQRVASVWIRKTEILPPHLPPLGHACMTGYGSDACTQA